MSKPTAKMLVTVLAGSVAEADSVVLVCAIETLNVYEPVGILR